MTRGLLDAVNRDELQGVVAHELSHVRNLDIRLMTVIAAMVGHDCAAVGLDGPRHAPYGSVAGASSRGRDKDKGGGAGCILLVVWIVAIVLAPLVGQMLAMMVSRRREYLADASGAELTRNPLALAGALEKIDAAPRPPQSMKRGTAHLCIADPLGRAMGLREGFAARSARIASAHGRTHRGPADRWRSRRNGPVRASDFGACQPASGRGRRAPTRGLVLLRVLSGRVHDLFRLREGVVAPGRRRRCRPVGVLAG